MTFACLFCECRLWECRFCECLAYISTFGFVFKVGSLCGDSPSIHATAESGSVTPALLLGNKYINSNRITEIRPGLATNTEWYVQVYCRVSECMYRANPKVR